MNNVMILVLSLSLSGSLLALLLFALMPIAGSRVSKAFRYYVWILVLLRFLIPFTFDASLFNRLSASAVTRDTTVLATLGTQTADPSTAKASDAAAESLANSPSVAQSPVSADTSLRPLLVAVRFLIVNQTAIWLIGAGIYLARYLVGYFRLRRRLLRTATHPHPMDLGVFTELRGAARVRLLCHPGIPTPLLLGVFRPCILIPKKAFVAAGMETELRNILSHELTHLKRHDLIYKWAIVFVGAVHWFNPLMILIRKRINQACELSCDEAVIRRLDPADRRIYGETLLTMAAQKHLPAEMITTTMCEEKRDLKERLQSILLYRSKSAATILLSVFLACTVAGCGLALGAATEGAKNVADITLVPNTSGGPTDPQASTSPNLTGTPSAESDDADSVPIRSVLLDQKEFYSVDLGKKILFSAYLSETGPDAPVFQATEFATVDLNADGVSESIVSLSANGELQMYLLLHNTGDGVSGYLVSNRAIQELKADGTFQYANSAASTGWGRVSFTSDGVTVVPISYTDGIPSDDGTKVTCVINGSPVTAEEYEKELANQEAKRSVSWYAFGADPLRENCDV